MKTRKSFSGLAVLAVATLSATAVAEPVPIDTTDPQTGMTQIYSATFDGAMAQCTAQSPAYCSFFNGEPPPSPPAVRAITFTPNPSGVVNGVPDGIGPGLPPISPPQPVPAPGSFLDLTRAPGNTSVTLTGGTIKFPDLPIVIRDETVINATGAGIAFNAAPQTAPLDANGVAEFLVNLSPTIAVDFSAFTVVATDCSGSLCALVQILTLDMIRYRLLIDYDDTFTSFTADFIGQTANNSFVYATLNSASPANVAVTDSIAPADDRQLPFGSVVQGEVRNETVTVTNNGASNFVVGQVAVADPLTPPFSVVDDNCSNLDLAPTASCTFGVEFAPTDTALRTQTLDIPTSDPATPVVTVTVSGGARGISVTDTDDPTNDLRAGFRTVLVSDTAERVITVANVGQGDLVLGTVGQVDLLAAPFAFGPDTCSGQIIAPAGTCTITTSFTPGEILAYADSFDIPFNDAEDGSVTFSLSGSGGGVVNPPQADGADSGFMAIDPLTLLGLGLFGAAARRRSRARNH
jgi:hypothetical protein